MYYTVDFRAIRHSLAADPARQPDLPRRPPSRGCTTPAALPCPTLHPGYTTLDYPALHHPGYTTLGYPVLHYLGTPPLGYPAQCTLYYPGLPCPVLPWAILPCTTLPYYSGLPGPGLPCPTTLGSPDPVYPALGTPCCTILPCVHHSRYTRRSAPGTPGRHPGRPSGSTSLRAVDARSQT